MRKSTAYSPHRRATRRPLIIRSLHGFAAVALMLVSALVFAQDEREFRAFAIAYQHEISRSESYASFRAAIREQFVTDVLPHLREDVPNLVSYPENQTLMAYLVGARGEFGRNSLDQAGAIAGLASLAGPYAAQIAYYEAQFPGVSAPGQLLHLGLTDTLARLVMETFAPLAEEFNVYLSVSSNLAAFEKIQGPEALLLADPEADTSYAYRATAPEIYNRNFVFGPNGELLTIQDKAYLVPIERDQGAGLGLLGIETYELPVFDLPFARIGTVISKDAWMPDVNDRLDQLGAELLIQPEAFSTWGVSGEDLWPPDKFQRGGWWMVQKHPSIQFNSTPMLTGNLGDLTFDGQPLLVQEGGPSSYCLMGQESEPGWLAVGVWSDYLEPVSLCDPARRPELAQQAVAMQPASGDERENLYADDVVYADLSLPPRPPRLGRVARGNNSVQRLETPGAALLPRLDQRGAHTWLAWVDSFSERRQSVALRRFDADAGWGQIMDFGEPATAFDHFDNQWSPSVLALEDASVVLAWTAFPTENWDLFSARVEVAGSGEAMNVPTQPTRLDDAEADAGVTRERGHSSPRLLSLRDGRQLAVWSDLRWPWIKPQVRFASSDDGGKSWQSSQRADAGPLSFEDEQLDARDPAETRGQSFPDALSLPDGGLLFAWQEADASAQAGIVLSEWDALGQPKTLRRIGLPNAYRPRLLGSQTGQWLIYEARDEAGGLQLYWHHRSGGDWTEAQRVDHSAKPGHQQRYAEPLAYNGQLYVVFTDDRAGDNDILLTRAGSASPLRLDAGPDGQDALVPTAVVDAGGEALVVWQEETEAGPQLAWTRLNLAESAAPRGGLLDLIAFALLLCGFAQRRCLH